MRIVTNTPLAKRNRQIATWLFLITLAVLIGGFIFLNYALFTGNAASEIIVLLQALTLPVAFILTLYSVRMTNLWAREPHPEKAIEEGLKGISKKSVLYNYYHMPARHVLIAPQGVFAIVTRWHEDRFTIEGDNWTTHKGAFSRFFSALRMDGVGNPTRDAERAAEYITDKLKDIAPNVEVKPLIIFVSEKAELEIENPDIPVLYASDKLEPNLTEYMRELNREQKSDLQAKVTLPLTQEQIDAFEAATLPQSAR